MKANDDFAYFHGSELKLIDSPKQGLALRRARSTQLCRQNPLATQARWQITRSVMPITFAQNFSMRKILRCGIHASSRHQEDFSCVWISHSGSWRKGADVNIISLGQVRTCDHPFMTWYRNSIRHISFCLRHG